MTEHAELLAEMPAVGRMTTAERLKHAHKRRAQQLKTWAQMEKEAPHRSRGGKAGKEGRRISFPNNVTLLEAAARNDLEEAHPTDQAPGELLGCLDMCWAGLCPPEAGSSLTFCLSFLAKFPKEDGHTRCVRCLGPVHAAKALTGEKDCSSCQQLTNRTSRRRAALSPSDSHSSEHRRALSTATAQGLSRDLWKPTYYSGEGEHPHTPGSPSPTPPPAWRRKRPSMELRVDCPPATGQPQPLHSRYPSLVPPIPPSPGELSFTASRLDVSDLTTSVRQASAGSSTPTLPHISQREEFRAVMQRAAAATDVPWPVEQEGKGIASLNKEGTLHSMLFLSVRKSVGESSEHSVHLGALPVAVSSKTAGAGNGDRCGGASGGDGSDGGGGDREGCVNGCPNNTGANIRSDCGLREFLKNGVSPDLYNEDGLTALHQCCIDDFEEVVRALVDAGANVNACDSELWTPLHAAATCGHMGLVEMLIKHGANMLAVNADGNMPYDLCEDEVTLDYIETAMANQGITQERIDECRSSKERQMVADIRALIQAGCDLNAQDENGTSLLHIAAANGYQSSAELLLEHKARVEVRDSDGWSPLHAASCWGQIQIVELLVANGANLNAKSVLEETPLDVCSDEEVRARLLDLKHKHDAIVKSQDRHKSALQRRASSTGSRGKVVRRVSVNERSNLYRREHEKEAIVWQERGRQPEPQDDDEDRQTDAELRHHSSSSGLDPQGESAQRESDEGKREPSVANGSTSALPMEPQGSWLDHSASYQLATEEPAEGDLSREKSHHTLADLKRQRAASKLYKHPSTTGDNSEDLPPLEPPRASTEASTVEYTPSSADPPLLKLRAPEEEPPPEKQRCCYLM
ncbi:PP16A phosphatase, partial [Polyodon spathula]|nr:PP16A phosphatase [Polyodon spathula]